MAERALRFGVGSTTNALRAASWKIWSPPGKDDIYIAGRELRGAVKVSLHESSNWHLAYDPLFFEDKMPEDSRSDEGRFIEKWRRPRSITPGVTLALRIVTPWTALRAGQPGRKIQLIDPPNEGRAREIGLLVIEPTTVITGWPGKEQGTQPIGCYDLVSGSSVWVVHWEIECPDFSSLGTSQAHLFRGVGREEISTDLRALVFGDHADGSKVIYDLAGSYSGGA